MGSLITNKSWSCNSRPPYLCRLGCMCLWALTVNQPPGRYIPCLPSLPSDPHQSSLLGPSRSLGQKLLLLESLMNLWRETLLLFGNPSPVGAGLQLCCESPRKPLLFVPLSGAQAVILTCLARLTAMTASRGCPFHRERCCKSIINEALPYFK